MELSLGYLFKKNNFIINKKSYEIFEFKDVVLGIYYTSSNNNKIFHVVTGDSSGIYASILNEKSNEDDDVVVINSLDNALKANDNMVDFSKMRLKMISKMGKYYIRYNKIQLQALFDKKIIAEIEKADKKKSREFDDEVLDATSDISEMYSSIKKTIIGQDEQTMMILTSLFKNQKVVTSELDIDLVSKLKENILIFGATGTGKTEILKRIAKLYDVPIVIADATLLSETGYHGRNVSDMLEDLYTASDKNIEIAEKGILVIDEFDKLAEKKEDRQSHVSRLGVQRSLLKLLDGVDFYLKDNICFNTSKLTIVALGAFTDIVDSTNRRRIIGFSNDINENNINHDDYRNVTIIDFEKYGIMRELIARFSKLVAMNSLNKEDIKEILIKSDLSPLNTYREMFNLMNIEFNYTNEFIDWLAERAIKLNTGARCLKTIFDECVSGAMFRIFAGEYTHLSLVRPVSEDDRPYILRKKNN